MTSTSIKVMIVDDHAMVRKGMRAFLSEFEDIHVSYKGRKIVK